jgi:hypothetical protein
MPAWLISQITCIPGTKINVGVTYQRHNNFLQISCISVLCNCRSNSTWTKQQNRIFRNLSNLCIVTNRYILYCFDGFCTVILRYWPPLWPSGQEFPATDPEVRVRFQALPDVLSSGSGTGPLSLVSATEELLRKSSVSYLKSREYGRRDPSRWPRGTLYPQKLALISPTSGGRSIGIVRSRTKTSYLLYFDIY